MRIRRKASIDFRLQKPPNKPANKTSSHMSRSSRSRNNSPSKQANKTLTASFVKHVGEKIRCTLVNDEHVEGIVYLYDQQAHALLLYTTREGDVFNGLRILNTANIKEHAAINTSNNDSKSEATADQSVTTQISKPDKVDSPRPSVSTPTGKAKKEAQNGKVPSSSISNPGSRRGSRPETPVKAPSTQTKGTEKSQAASQVSEECKTIFDALARHFKCKIQGSSIIVSDDFRIDAPYTPDATKSIRSELSETQATALTRLKKVLESERSVLPLHKKTASGGGSRKKRDEKLPLKGG